MKFLKTADEEYINPAYIVKIYSTWEACDDAPQICAELHNGEEIFIKYVDAEKDEAEQIESIISGFMEANR